MLSVVESAIPSSRSRGDLVTWVWQVLLLAALYVVVGRLGLELTYYQVSDLPLVVWPPAGLSLAALILFGRRLWPGVFMGALLVNLGIDMAWLPSTGVAIANTLEALVGVTLLIRVADFRPTLERMRDGVVFLFFGVLGCTTVGATVGTCVLSFFGVVDAVQFWRIWLIYWLGGVGGVLILTPLLLMLVHGTPPWRSLTRRLESWLALAFLFITGLFAFFGPSLGLLGFAASVAPFPVLVWAGARLGPRGATIASSLSITIAAIATGTGSGPFVFGTTTEAMILLWVYSMCMGITAFTLAAVTEQRNVADRRYRSEEVARLRTEKQKLLLLERERLTREMHDGLGGQLVSVLSMVERGLADPSEVAEALRRAIDEIGIVIDSLDPSTTDLSTSLGKLRARLEPLLRRNGIDLLWRIDDIPDLDAFPPEAALHVLRIIQEAVTNTLRHANADRVEVRITSSSDAQGQLHISIHDDGRGLPTPMSTGGRGIQNMNSRAQELGAVLRIEGTNSGTQVELTVPFPH